MIAPYIDIHSHYPAPDQDIYTLRNVYENFEQVNDMQACSAGLHPWYLADIPAQITALERCATLPQVKAIGECGLDKVCATPWASQEEAFRLQIGLANRLQKPLIIHCVRAYTEVLHQLKAAHVPVIFHGFRKNPALAATIWEQGHYLSFGQALVRGEPNALASLEQAPPDRFFLETDDNPVSIKTVYHAAAQIRKTGEDALILQLQQNYKRIFSI